VKQIPEIVEKDKPSSPQRVLTRTPIRHARNESPVRKPLFRQTASPERHNPQRRVGLENPDARSTIRRTVKSPAEQQPQPV